MLLLLLMLQLMLSLLVFVGVVVVIVAVVVDVADVFFNFVFLVSYCACRVLCSMCECARASALRGLARDRGKDRILLLVVHVDCSVHSLALLVHSHLLVHGWFC